MSLYGDSAYKKNIVWFFEKIKRKGRKERKLVPDCTDDKTYQPRKGLKWTWLAQLLQLHLWIHAGVVEALQSTERIIYIIVWTCKKILRNYATEINQLHFLTCTWYIWYSYKIWIFKRRINKRTIHPIYALRISFIMFLFPLFLLFALKMLYFVF